MNPWQHTEFVDDFRIPVITPEFLEPPTYDRPVQVFSQARLIADEAGLADAMTQVLAFLETPRKELDLPFDIRGSALQQA